MKTPPPPPPYETVAADAAAAPAWSRRARKEQRRAVQRMAREQRELVRLQMRALRRRSLVGPAFLVSVGVVFLLVELGTVSLGSLLPLFAKWWPGVLLLAGLVLLAEWAADTWIAGRGTGLLPPRRTLGAGSVLFLTVLTVAGVGAMRLHPSAGWFQEPWADSLVRSWGLEDLFAQRTETDQELSAPLRAGEVLTIRNYRGDVTVTGNSTDGLVHVAVHRRLIAWRREDLRARAKEDAVRLAAVDSGVSLIAGGEGQDETNLTIEVPHKTGVTIAKEAGQICISELRGPVTVLDHSGTIALTGVVGSVHLSSHDDDASITGHSLDGDVVVEGRSGDLAFSDVRGSLTLRGDFFGTTHLERVEGPVHFASSFTDWQCAGLPGEMTVEGRSELKADNVQGPLLLQTSDRQLTLTDLHGGITVTNRNGSVTIGLAELRFPVKVETSAGSIDVRVPEGASFAVDASTTNGQISNDVGVASDARDGSVIARGKVGHGGPSLMLRSTDGDLLIHVKELKTDGDRDSDDRDDENAKPNARQTRTL